MYSLFLLMIVPSSFCNGCFDFKYLYRDNTIEIFLIMIFQRNKVEKVVYIIRRISFIFVSCERMLLKFVSKTYKRCIDYPLIY